VKRPREVSGSGSIADGLNGSAGRWSQQARVQPNAPTESGADVLLRRSGAGAAHGSLSGARAHEDLGGRAAYERVLWPRGAQISTSRAQPPLPSAQQQQQQYASLYLQQQQRLSSSGVGAVLRGDVVTDVDVGHTTELVDLLRGECSEEHTLKVRGLDRHE
jgi:hypothetical protein